MMIRHHPLVVVLLSAGLSIATSEKWRPPDQGGAKAAVLKRSSASASSRVETPRVCAAINETICQTSLYRHTLVPNEWGQATQADAAAQLSRLSWILESGCSQRLPIFMCIFFFPVCSEKALGFPYTSFTVVSKPPCADMCKDIHSECFPWLHHRGFDWPSTFSCDKLPPRGGDEECYFPVTTASAIKASKEAIANMAKAGVVGQDAVDKIRINPGESIPEERVGEGHDDRLSLHDDDDGRESGIIEPESNVVFLISLSVVISLFLLLIISVCLVRCYFQVCTGTPCHEQCRRSRRRTGRTSFTFCCRISDCFRRRSVTKSASSRPILADTSMHDLQPPLPLPPAGESTLHKKRAWSETEEQSKTMSIFDVEESTLPTKNGSAVFHSNIYNKFADHQHLVPQPALSKARSVNSSQPENLNTAKRPIQPPQSLSFAENLSHGLHKPAVGWKRSSDALADQTTSPDTCRRNMIPSLSMTFEREGPPQKHSKTLPSPKSVRFQQQSLSKSQPDLEKPSPPVWRHRYGVQQCDVFTPTVTIRRSRTASVGVGTSPSLEHRKPMTPISRDREAQTSTPEATAQQKPLVQQRLSRPRTRVGSSLVSASDINCQLSARSTYTGPRRAVTPTKYSITLFLDEAQKLSNGTTTSTTVKTLEERKASTIRSPSKEFAPPPSRYDKIGSMGPYVAKSLPMTPLIITPIPPTERTRGSVSSERQPQQQKPSTRDLFYV